MQIPNSKPHWLFDDSASDEEVIEFCLNVSPPHPYGGRGWVPMGKPQTRWSLMEVSHLYNAASFVERNLDQHTHGVTSLYRMMYGVHARMILKAEWPELHARVARTMKQIRDMRTYAQWRQQRQLLTEDTTWKHR